MFLFLAIAKIGTKLSQLSLKKKAANFMALPVKYHLFLNFAKRLMVWLVAFDLVNINK